MLEETLSTPQCQAGGETLHGVGPSVVVKLWVSLSLRWSHLDCRLAGMLLDLLETLTEPLRGWSRPTPGTKQGEASGQPWQGRVRG